MVLIQIELTEKNDLNLRYYQLDNNIGRKSEAINQILKKHFKKEESKCNTQKQETQHQNKQKN